MIVFTGRLDYLRPSHWQSDIAQHSWDTTCKEKSIKWLGDMAFYQSGQQHKWKIYLVQSFDLYLSSPKTGLDKALHPMDTWYLSFQLLQSLDGGRGVTLERQKKRFGTCKWWLNLVIFTQQLSKLQLSCFVSRWCFLQPIIIVMLCPLCLQNSFILATQLLAFVPGCVLWQV